MHYRMASHAQRYQILFGIITTLAAKILVVNLKVRPGPARLASPTVAAQHLLPESIVRLAIEPQAWLFGKNLGSRGLLDHFVQKSLPLFARKEFEKP